MEQKDTELKYDYSITMAYEKDQNSVSTASVFKCSNGPLLYRA